MKKEGLFDPVRGRETADTPEERVRRDLVDWLIGSVGVPPRLLSVEYSLSALDPSRRDRADVVAWRPSAAGGLSPWLLAECKAPSIPLGEDAADQVRRYAGAIPAEHVVLTNGRDTRCYRLEASRYVEQERLPRFPSSTAS